MRCSKASFRRWPRFAPRCRRSSRRARPPPPGSPTAGASSTPAQERRGGSASRTGPSFRRPSTGRKSGWCSPSPAARRALRASAEGAEDDRDAAKRALADFAIGARDVVIGLAASGATPYTLEFVQGARNRGALTVGVANNPNTPLLESAEHPILIDTGPEVLAGSTRMKAGTAQKVVLNLLSTLVMIRLGRVYRGLMVDMRSRNAKLKRRATVMIGHLAHCDDETAKRAFDAAGGDVKLAVLVAKGIDVATAKALIGRSRGHLRSALAHHEA